MPTDSVRVRFLGNARVAHHCPSVLEAKGRSRSHSRRRCSSSWEPIVLEWISAYVVGKTVNATLGDSIDTALRAVVERTIAEFKERYPN